MKRFFKKAGPGCSAVWVGMLCSAFVLGACSDDDETARELALAADLTYGSEGGVRTATVTANGSWTVSSDAEWLEFSVAEGEGNGKIEVTASENLSLSERRATVTVSSGVLSEQVQAVQTALRAEALDASGTANSYIISGGPGLYYFRAEHKGNSAAEAVGEWTSASLVWQDAAGLITAVRCVPGEHTVLLTVGESEGNAVVAVAGADGTTLWSWHIWVTDYDPASTAFVSPPEYGGGTVWTFMDRNLGALSAEPGSLDALGLLYQWGRKDPFTSSAAYTEEERPRYDIDGDLLPSFEELAQPNGTLALSAANPGVFYTVSYPTGDWHDASSDDMWGGVSGAKTVYDPCPPGWRVPVSDAAGNTPYGFLTHDNSPWSDENRGRLYEAGSWWLPAAGTRVNETGGLSIDVSSGYGGVWFGTHGKAAENLDENPALYGQYMFVGSGKRTFKVMKDTRAQGMSVRCVAE